MLTHEQYRKLSDEENNKKWKNSCKQYKNLVLKKLPDVSRYAKKFSRYIYKSIFERLYFLGEYMEFQRNFCFGKYKKILDFL